ncbi:hypothetical protein M758_6G206000 [Ceratodon purpureus]|nr:hypothetical protein M758_6G206000 [Ceratodon purpureus]
MVHAAAVRDACPQAVAPAFPCAFLTCLPALPTGSCQSSWRTANEDAYVGLAQAAWRWCSLRCMLRGEELQHYEIVEQPGLE